MWESVFSVAILLLLAWLLLFGLLEGARRWARRKPGAETAAFWLWAVICSAVLLVITLDPSPSMSIHASAGPSLSRLP